MGTPLIQLIALILTMAYGVGFAFFDGVPTWYSIGGAFVVAVVWLAVGYVVTQRRQQE